MVHTKIRLTYEIIIYFHTQVVVVFGLKIVIEKVCCTINYSMKKNHI